MPTQDVPPAEPPYVEERLSLKYAGLRMPAALTLPREGEPESAVLLVPGSLFVDVDGNLPFMDAWPHNTADLARQLAERGHAVLRYAKPGPGTGTEEVDAEAAKAHGRFLTRVDVARTGLDTLLARVHAPAVAAGHSEGAVVVALLANADERVRGVVSLSGPSVGLFDIMREQLPLPPGSPPEAYASFDSLVATLRENGDIDPASLADDPLTAGMSRLDRDGLRYITQIDAVDPAEAYAAVPVPVLLVQGGRDHSVRPHHMRRLAEARGDRPTETAFFEALQHFYKRVPEGMDPFASFQVDAESDPAVADALAEWGDRTATVGRAGAQ